MFPLWMVLTPEDGLEEATVSEPSPTGCVGEHGECFQRAVAHTIACTIV